MNKIVSEKVAVLRAIAANSGVVPKKLCDGHAFQGHVTILRCMEKTPLSFNGKQLLLNSKRRA